ncbi:MAG: flagellar protein FlgN [Chitinophagales bacterium]
MERVLTDLLQNLTIESDIIGRMMDLAQQKRQVVISGDLNELDAVVRRENALVFQLEKVEKRRYQDQNLIADLLEMNREETTASNIIARIERFDGKWANALKEKVNNLVPSLKLLREINEQNDEIINDALAFTRTMEGIFSVFHDVTYSSQGMVNQASRPRGLLDKKI